MSLKRCDPGHCPLCDDARRTERNAERAEHRRALREAEGANVGRSSPSPSSREPAPACPVLVGIVECPPSLFVWLRQYAEILGATSILGADYRYSVRMTSYDYETYVKPRQREGDLLAIMRDESPRERKERRYAEAEAAEAARRYDAQDELELERYRRTPKHARPERSREPRDPD